MANLPLTFFEFLAGGVLVTAGVTGASLGDTIQGKISGIKPLVGAPSQSQFSSTSGSVTGASGTATGNAATALTAAEAVSALNLPYSTSVQTSGPLAGFRQDCSGFVDYLLEKMGVEVNGATTVDLPQYLQSGQGQQVTVWNLPNPGQLGHVIISIAGQWFESGGMSGGGPHQMTPAQAAAELGVSSVSDLTNATTPRGFEPLHPAGD